MKALKLLVLGMFFYVLSTPSSASEIVHQFSNPSFSGNGYSTHVLSLEQLRYSREKNVKDDAKSAAAAAARAENNTTINKFLTCVLKFARSDNQITHTFSIPFPGSRNSLGGKITGGGHFSAATHAFLSGQNLGFLYTPVFHQLAVFPHLSPAVFG